MEYYYFYSLMPGEDVEYYLAAMCFLQTDRIQHMHIFNTSIIFMLTLFEDVSPPRQSNLVLL